MTINNKSTFLLLFFLNNIFAQQPLLVLHFDVNKTLIAMDAVQGKSLEKTINNILAEHTYACWNCSQKEQSFYDYATERTKNDNPDMSEASEEFKQRRNEYLDLFPQFLTSHNKEYVEYRQNRDKMREILGKEKTVIFPSFYKLIDWLNENHKNNYTIHLRTFGSDLPEVMPTIEKKSQYQLLFDTHGAFQEQKLEIYKSKSSTKVYETIETTELYQFFANKQSKHYAIKDDYSYWKSKKFQSEGGKLFPIDTNDAEVISAFFDDNANDKIKPIIHPVKPDGSPLNIQELIDSKNIVPVNPKEAILDENYFIEKVKTVIKKFNSQKLPKKMENIPF